MGSLSRIPDDSPFTLDNIPFGVFSTKEDSTPRCATAIGDFALDLRALSQSDFFQDNSATDALCQVREAAHTIRHRCLYRASLGRDTGLILAVP